MPIDHIPPLDEEQWDHLMKELNKPPDPEKVKRLKEAIENAKKMKEFY